MHDHRGHLGKLNSNFKFFWVQIFSELFTIIRISLQLEKGILLYASCQLFKGDMVHYSTHCTAYVNVGRKKRRSSFMHTSSILSTLILATSVVSTMQTTLPNNTMAMIKCISIMTKNSDR